MEIRDNICIHNAVAKDLKEQFRPKLLSVWGNFTLSENKLIVTCDDPEDPLYPATIIDYITSKYPVKFISRTGYVYTFKILDMDKLLALAYLLGGGHR